MSSNKIFLSAFASVSLFVSLEARALDFTVCNEPSKKDGSREAIVVDPTFGWKSGQTYGFFTCKGYLSPAPGSSNPHSFSCSKGYGSPIHVKSRTDYGYNPSTHACVVKKKDIPVVKKEEVKTPAQVQIVQKEKEKEVQSQGNNVVVTTTNDTNACLSECSKNVNNLLNAGDAATKDIAAEFAKNDVRVCAKYKDKELSFSEITNGCACKKSNGASGQIDLALVDAGDLKSSINSALALYKRSQLGISTSLDSAYSTLKDAIKAEIVHQCSTYAGTSTNDRDDASIPLCEEARIGEKCRKVSWKNNQAYEEVGVKKNANNDLNTVLSSKPVKNVSPDGKSYELVTKESVKDKDASGYMVGNEKLKMIDGQLYKVDSNGNALDENGKIITDINNPGKGYSGSYTQKLKDGSTIKYDEKGEPLAKYNSKGEKTFEYSRDPKTQEIIANKIVKDKDGNVIAKDTPESRKAEREAARLANDPCKLSTQMNANWKCRGTQTLVDISKAQAQVTQLAGAAGVQISGRKAVEQYQQSGKMSDAYKGAEKAFKSAKNAQIITGVVNAAAYAMLKNKEKQHDQNSYQIENSADAYGAKLEEVAKRNGLTTDQAKQKMLEEQGEMLQQAKERSTTHLFQGVVAIAQAVKFGQDEKHNRQQAADLAGMEKKAGTINGNPYVVKDDGSDKSAITNQGGSSGQSVTTAGGSGNGGGLGDGLGLGDAGNDPAGPKAGIKNLAGGGPPAGAPGGGGGGLGGGGSVAAPNVEEGKAQYAGDMTEAKDKFEMGGGNIQTGGGKAKGGSEGSSGLDLNNLLAQFLPKDEKPGEDGGNNGILSYQGAANRGLASAEQGNYLDQRADIFERLSKKYHGLVEAKRVSAE